MFLGVALAAGVTACSADGGDTPISAPGADASMIDARDDRMDTDAAPDAMVATGDTCQTADVIVVPGGLGTATVSGTTAGKTSAYAPDCTVFGTDGPDHVYQITIPAGAHLDAAVTPVAAYDAAIYLVASPAAMCDVDPIVCLSADDNGSEGVRDDVQFGNTGAAPTDVFIVVDGSAAFGGSYTLAVTVAAVPPGEICQLAESVTLVGGVATISGTTATAANYTNNYVPPAACTDTFTQRGNDRVYQLTVPANQRLSATVTPTAFDAGLYFIAAPAAMCDATPIACLAGHDRDLSGVAETVTYDNATAAPLDIFVVVDSFSTATPGGAYSLAVTVAAIPPGDTCQLAEPVTLVGGVATISGTIATAANYTNNYVPPAACTDTFAQLGNDRVYQLTVPANQRLSATVTPTAFDAGLYFIAAPAAMCDATPIACLAGHDRGFSGVAETVIYDNATAAPLDIFVVVDSFSTATPDGAYSLAVTVGAIP
ncbi:MAG: hypothetical protein H7138_12070 [Myxococcales bacterium]|nr:hypothetical protein [Myxococcales bacterium]